MTQEITSLFEKLKNDKVIQAIPKLRNTVKALETSVKRSSKISGKYSEVVSLMADGVEYGEAIEKAGL